MRAAVIVAGLDGRDRAGVARIAQVRALYAALGLEVDLAVLAPADAAPVGPSLPAQFRRCGFLPNGAVDGDAGVVARFLLRLNDGQAYALGHLAAEGVATARAAAARWIAEPPGAAEADLDADMFLAEIEPWRARLAAGGVGLRLPRVLEAFGPDARGQGAGWIGTFSEARAATWSEALAILSRHGVELPGGLVLAGPGVPAVAVPDNLVQQVAVDMTGGHRSVLGLGVVPDPPLPQDLAAVAELLGLGRPVLLGPEGAAVHEGRWHMPTVRDPGEVADRIGRWMADPQALEGGRRATIAAFGADLAAMTRHVGDRIARLLAG